MYLLQGGFAPLVPDPSLPGLSNQTLEIMRYLKDLAMHALIAQHPGIAK